SAAMDAAFAAVIPERARAAAGTNSPPFFGLHPPIPTEPVPEPMLDTPPQPVRPEVANAEDLLRDLEREIFRDEPSQDHPTAMESPPIQTVAPLEPAAPVTQPPTADLREVPVDSRQDPPAAPAAPADLFDLAAIEALAAAEPAPTPVEAVAEHVSPPTPVEAVAEHDSPPPPVEAMPAGATRRPDNAMRLAVGLGAAACVLLAAFLYEGGLLSHGSHKTGAAVATARSTATAHSLPPASTAPSASAPATPAAPILFSLGNGVTGGTVYRIRPGTAVAGYTRLVFDIRGRGIPSMVIAQPDSTHITITFRQTTGAAVPVAGIRSFQVAAVEPAVQQGPDLVITVDLARTNRVTAFTLPAAGTYSHRLVVDLHTS
ncbi:MAG TPA: hypothetical protein VLS53_05660, partial [Candidatus Dormibacteraeota bacterium]|nr:hypothetical protein [Candidatus Dormibacteraeota bacterium]